MALLMELCRINNITIHFVFERGQNSGHWSDVVPPLPIPNRVVKHVSADDSMGATPCENRSWPEFCPFLWS